MRWNWLCVVGLVALTLQGCSTDAGEERTEDRQLPVSALGELDPVDCPDVVASRSGVVGMWHLEGRVPALLVTPKGPLERSPGDLNGAMDTLFDLIFEIGESVGMGPIQGDLMAEALPDAESIVALDALVVALRREQPHLTIGLCSQFQEVLSGLRT